MLELLLVLVGCAIILIITIVAIDISGNGLHKNRKAEMEYLDKRLTAAARGRVNRK